MTKDRAAAVATTVLAILMDRLRDPHTRDEILTVLRGEFDDLTRQIRNELHPD